MKISQLALLQHSCGLARVSETGPPKVDDDDLARAAHLIAQGAFLDAVRTTPSVRALLDCSSEVDVVHDAASYYMLVGRRAAAAVEAAISEPVSAAAATSTALSMVPCSSTLPPEVQLEAVLVAGVACLHVFGQHNLTGPCFEGPPPTPLDIFAPPAVAKSFAEAPPRPPPSVTAAAIAAITGENTPATSAATSTAAIASDVAAASAAEAAAPASSPDGLGGLGVDSLSRGDRWAREQLQLDGEDLVGRCPAVQWLLLARLLLLGSLQTGQPQQQEASSSAGSPEQAQEDAPGAVAAYPGQGAAPACTAAAVTAAPLGRLTALLATCHRGAVNGCSSNSSGSSGVNSSGHRSWSWVWSWPWWTLRCVLSQQRALDGRSHSLLSEASQLIQALLSPGCPWTHPLTATTDSDTSRPTGREVVALGGVLYIELALCQYQYGYVDAGRQYLTRAGQLLGLEAQLTGALGKRTVHQIDPKAQLVVVASESLRSAPPAEIPGEPVELLGLSGGSSSGPSGGPASRELEGLTDDSDVFPAPVLLGEDGALLETRYSPPEQALLLGWATAVKKGTSADELQEWQMAPWVEAVLSQTHGSFMTLAAAKLSKTRHERSRGRTRERALLHIDQLAEAVTAVPPPPPPSAATAAAGAEPPAAAAVDNTAAAAAVASTPCSLDPELSAPSAVSSMSGRRAVLSWAVWFPLQVKLRQEAAEHYVSMGLVGAAIRVFEALELWDSALTCYRLVGKKALAEELIKRRLAVTPDDPKLWCALGDLHMDDRYYEEAWRRSAQRHNRSQRSLARNAMRRKDYAKASGHWKAALGLNPLHPESWFSLGFCLLKQDRHREALRAFTRVTQQEPDNGEAWNNIAALWMHVGGYRPAFAALSESVRHKRDSWQTWENYARAALASGHYQAAVRGLQMSLRLSSGQRLCIEVASGLLDVLEGRPPPRDGATSLAAAAAAAAEGLQGVAGDAGEVEGPQNDTSLQEDEAALGVPLLPLLSDLPLRPLGEPEEEEEGTDDAGAAAAAAAAAAAQPQEKVTAGDSAAPSSDPQQTEQEPQLLSGREREVVLGGLGSLLREAVNSPAASAALWGCLARYWALRGEADSAREARLKQVRGLSSGAFKSDATRFTEYAEASEALGRCYLDSFNQGRPGGLKDLAAGRMHLRGLLRATAENFGEHPLTAKLQALLEEITKVEDEALAASRAAVAARS